MIDGADGITAADDADCAGIGHSLAYAHGAGREFGHFKAAHRAIPDYGLGSLDFGGIQLQGFRADVQSHPTGRNVFANDLGIGVSIEFISRDIVYWEQEFDAGGLGCVQRLFGGFEQVVFAQRRADLMAERLQEGIGHAAADQERVDVADQVLQDFQLAGNFGAADDRHKGTLRFFQSQAEIVNFLLHQEAGDARSALGAHVLADDRRGGVLAFRCAKGVVDIDVTIGGQFRRHRVLQRLVLGLELGSILVAQTIGLGLGLFAFFKAGVLQHQNLPGLQRGDSSVSLHAVRRELDWLAQYLGQIFSHWLQAQFRLVAIGFRTTQVAHQGQSRALVKDVLNGRQGRLNAGVIRDLAVLERDVEVNPHNDFFACERYVFYRFFVHVLFASKELVRALPPPLAVALT